MLSPRARELVSSIRAAYPLKGQFAFVTFGVAGAAAARHPGRGNEKLWSTRRQRRSPVEYAAALEAAVLAPGGILIARSHSEPKDVDTHCEAMLLSRLRAEPRAHLLHLEPLIMYSWRCPCASCAARIADFRWEMRNLRVEVAYTRANTPPQYARWHMGLSDETSIRQMMEAGVIVEQLPS